MKKIFSILLTALTLTSGIALAYNVQDDAICSEIGHTGYSITGTPPTDFDPDAEELPAGVNELGQFETNFECNASETQRCHWAYIPASNPNEEGTWVECSGQYVDLN